MLFFFLNLNPHHGKTLREHAREFDFVGLFLFVGGVVCLLLGFNQSQNGCKCGSLERSNHLISRKGINLRRLRCWLLALWL
jgi:hypothetical protein